jgi:hypothetical protein
MLTLNLGICANSAVRHPAIRHTDVDQADARKAGMVFAA